MASLNLQALGVKSRPTIFSGTGPTLSNPGSPSPSGGFPTGTPIQSSHVSRDAAPVGSTPEGSTYYDPTTGQLNKFTNGQWSVVPANDTITTDNTPTSTAPSQAVIDPLLSALTGIDTSLAGTLGNAQTKFDNVIKGYNDQDALDANAHANQVTQNDQQLASNRWLSLLENSRSLGGLRSVLDSFGGLAGDGANIARSMAESAANRDFGDAKNNFETNTEQIGTNWQQALHDAEQRRQDANAALGADQAAARLAASQGRQNIFEKLANLFGTDTAQGQSYASKAGGENADIAKFQVAANAPGKYASASPLFTPQALQNVLSRTRQVGLGNGASQEPINSPLYQAPDRRKDQLPAVA